MVWAIIGTVAGALALVGPAARWAWRRRLRLDVTHLFGTRPDPDGNVGNNIEIVTAKIRNRGRDVVVEEVGIARAVQRPKRQQDVSRSRGDRYSPGHRLSLEDTLEGQFEVRWLPPTQPGEYDSMPLWSFVRLSDGRCRYSRHPVQVHDLRPGSPTVDQTIFP